MKNRNYDKKSRGCLKRLYKKRSVRCHELWSIIAKSNKFKIKLSIEDYEEISKKIAHEEGEMTIIYYLLHNKDEKEEDVKYFIDVTKQYKEQSHQRRFESYKSKIKR